MSHYTVQVDMDDETSMYQGPKSPTIQQQAETIADRVADFEQGTQDTLNLVSHAGVCKRYGDWHKQTPTRGIRPTDFFDVGEYEEKISAYLSDGVENIAATYYGGDKEDTADILEHWGIPEDDAAFIETWPRKPVLTDKGVKRLAEQYAHLASDATVTVSGEYGGSDNCVNQTMKLIESVSTQRNDDIDVEQGVVFPSREY